MADLIVLQKLLPDFIEVHFESGRVEMRPYEVDELGSEYADLFPNDRLIGETN